MSRDHIRKLWNDFVNLEKYKKYFISNEEEWMNNLIEVKKYIDENKKKPSDKDKNKQIKKLGLWMNRQNNKFNKQIEIMKNEQIRNEWSEFINSVKYFKYFLSNEEEWINNLNQVKKYIDTNNKRPSEDNKNQETKKLGNWTTFQNKNYKNKTQIMKNEQYRNEWENFINSENYKKYFISNEEEWMNNLNEVKNYIDSNNKKPSIYKEDNKHIKKLGMWIATQTQKYKKQMEIMKNEKIKSEWENFITSEKYSKYFNKIN